jgi:hypothetical protein
MRDRPHFIPSLPALALSAAILGASVISGAAAQVPLADLAPPGAALAIALDTTSAPPEALRRDLAALDWQGAATSLRAIASAFGEPDVASLLEWASAIVEPAEELCPGLPASLRAFAPGARPLPPLEALLAAELSNGRPVLTGIARLAQASPARVAALRVVLRGCADGVERVEGVPVDLLLFGRERDRLNVLLFDDGLLIAGNDRQAALDAWLRANGRLGSSLADGALLAPARRFDRGSPSVSVAVSPEALLDFLAALGLIDPDSSGGPLGERLSASVDTIDVIAARWGLGSDGLISEWAIEIDPGRPDPELASLLHCPECRVARPYLAPEGAFTVSSSRLPLRALTEWVSAWVVAAGEADPLETVRREAGIDLRADLLDWLGDQVHIVLLEPHSTDLRTLLYQPGEVIMIPVSSEGAASAGLERMERVLVEHLGAGGGRLLGEVPIALRSVEYRGIPYRRLQTSINVDLGVALVGNHLVIAAPSSAVEVIVDTFMGGPAVVGEARYRDAAASAPARAHALSLQDTSAQLDALAGLARLVAQPLAFGLDIALYNETRSESWPVDLAGLEAQPLSPGAHTGILTDGSEPGAPADQWVEGSLSDLFRLEGVRPGDGVVVVVESDRFDTMVHVHDARNGVELYFNDDAPDIYRSEVGFTAKPDEEYLVQVTSYSGDDTGEYLLTVETGAGAVPLDPPGFTRILELLELPASLLDVLAEHFHTTVGYTVSEENTLYSRTVTSPAR